MLLNILLKVKVLVTQPYLTLWDPKGGPEDESVSFLCGKVE